VSTSRFYLSKPGTAVVPPTAGRPSGAGHPLPSGLRAALEPRFHHDFSRVRVHSDGEASVSAQALGTPAFTVGRDIMLGRGGLGTDPAQGHRLIAHELAHVVQSERGGSATTATAAEEDAHQAGERAAAGHDARVEASAPAGQPLCAPPQLAPPQMAPDVGWKPPELETKWYTLEGFDTKESALKPDHDGIIDEVVKDLVRDPLMGGFITVVGYADAIGTSPENKVLGQQRADAVRAALVDKGVSPDDLRAYSLGEDVAATPKASAKERRVEIVVRRRRFTPAPRTPAPTLESYGPVAKDKTGDTGPIRPERSDAEKDDDRRKEFERRIRQLAVEKGAKKQTPFDEAVKYLADQAAPDLANEVAKIAESMGFDRKRAKELVEKGIEKGIEAGLKEALKTILTAIAGSPSPRPSSETGPATFEKPKPMIIPIPIPVPGDKPKPANTTNPTLQVTDRLSATMTKLVYKRGEFISFRFTTPESFGQVRAVVEIVPAGGDAAVRTLGITGRRAGNEALEVPGAVGSFVLQVRLVGEDPHPRGTFRFSVE
jgi:outer membrane protein OmpA-like peptidoglycan-associated protein